MEQGCFVKERERVGNDLRGPFNEQARRFNEQTRAGNEQAPFGNERTGHPQ